jgi:hypothetical protein
LQELAQPCSLRSPLRLPLARRPGRCGRTALHFNEAIAKNSKELENLVKTFDRAVQQAKDPAKRTQAYDKLVADASKAIEEGKAIKVPDIAEANELHKAYLEYLSAEEKILKRDFPGLLEAVNSGNLERAQ